MHERTPEVGGGFPDRVVEISRAFPDRAVKLGRDEARLPFHEPRIVLPGLEEDLLVGLVEREDVDQHDGAGLDGDLAFDRESGVKWTHGWHDDFLSIWVYDVNLV